MVFCWLLLREGKRESEKERDLKVLYIVPAHGQAACFTDCLLYLALTRKSPKGVGGLRDGETDSERERETES